VACVEQQPRGARRAAIAAPERAARPGGWRNVPELDGVRALAVAAVVGFHYDYALVRGGYLGVPVFFVLSGYLITGLLLAEERRIGRIDLRAFYARRALRLYPALVAVVVGVLVVSAVVGHRGVSSAGLWTTAGVTLVYANDFLVAAGHSTRWLDPTWSLGVEEQFYLLWPILLSLAVARTVRVARWCIAAAVVFAALDAVLRPVIGALPAYFTPFGSVLPLMLGCALAFMRRDLLSRAAARALVLAGGAALIVALFTAAADQSVASFDGWEQGAAIASAALVYGLANAGFALMRWAPLVWLGRRSYGIYLVHHAVLAALENLLPAASAGELAAIGIPLSVALATLSYRYVETPFLRRRRRFARAAPAGYA